MSVVPSTDVKSLFRSAAPRKPQSLPLSSTQPHPNAEWRIGGTREANSAPARPSCRISADYWSAQKGREKCHMYLYMSHSGVEFGCIPAEAAVFMHYMKRQAIHPHIPGQRWRLQPRAQNSPGRSRNLILLHIPKVLSDPSPTPHIRSRSMEETFPRRLMQMTEILAMRREEQQLREQLTAAERSNAEAEAALEASPHGCTQSQG